MEIKKNQNRVIKKIQDVVIIFLGSKSFNKLIINFLWYFSFLFVYYYLLVVKSLGKILPN
jgi:hypothetical protein